MTEAVSPVNGRHQSTTTPHVSMRTGTAAPTLVYSDMVQEDIEPVLSFMAEHFYPREPLSIGLKITWEDNNEWILDSLKSWLPSGVSVVARDADTGAIAGTIVSTILTKNSNTSFDSALSSPNTKVKRLHAVLSILEDSVDLFERFPVDKILELAMITVSDQYGRRGVGRRLVQESERRGQDLGCEASTSQATAGGSQCLLQRLGYETLYEMKYSNFTYAGESVLDLDSMLGCASAKVMARWLAPATPTITKMPIHLEGSTRFDSLQKKQECVKKEEDKVHVEQDGCYIEPDDDHTQQENGQTQQNGGHKVPDDDHKQQKNGQK